MQMLIRKAKVIDSQSDFHGKVVDILVEDGVIKSIGSSIDANADEVIEGENLHVSGGWVDVFADYREPGYEHKETIESGLDAAAAGGFTEVLLAPNTQPVISTKSIVQYILKKAHGHTVELHPIGAVTQDTEGKNLAEMLDMRGNGAVAFSDGWKPVQNANLMLKALEYIKAFNGVIIQLPIDNSLAAGGLMHEGPVSTRLGMAGIPDLAETLMIHRDIELLRYTGSRLHISGVSTAEGLDMIRKAKAEGLNITCSVTPYHLALNDEALQEYSSLYKVSPVLRSEADRQALIAGLQDGTIDCITSHHRPQDWDAKEKEFEYAAEGMNLEQIVFPVVWQAVKGKVDIEKVVAALSANPRKIFGLKEAAIKEQNNAEITIFTTEGTTVAVKEDMKSAGMNNPFLGKELSGKIISIIS